VRRSLLDDVAAMEKVIAAWLHAMRWALFWEIRWLPVGLSARGMLRTLHMGVGRRMEVTRASGVVSEYYAHGFDRCTQEVKRYLSACALASCAMGAVQAEVLHNDRVARNIECVLEELRSELVWLGGISFGCWARLASPLCMSSAQLRTSVLAAAHTSAAYLWGNSIEQVWGHPWSLGRGEVEQNVEALRALPELADATVARMWRLLHRGLHSTPRYLPP